MPPSTANANAKKKPQAMPQFLAGKWRCPRCKNLVEIMVEMTVNPSCYNHTGKAIVEMERISK